MSDATRRTLRTALAVLLAVVAFIPVLVAELGVDLSRVPWLATIVAVAAAITRIMQSPAVDDLLTRLRIGREPAAPPTVDLGAVLDPVSTDPTPTGVIRLPRQGEGEQP